MKRPRRVIFAASNMAAAARRSTTAWSTAARDTRGTKKDGEAQMTFRGGTPGRGRGRREGGHKEEGGAAIDFLREHAGAKGRLVDAEGRREGCRCVQGRAKDRLLLRHPRELQRSAERR